ncbi:hypothetical protein GA0074696_3203 [Micromonospora purpureochromogenes]|uniref:Uncharacterized protein n=1 Tax=Micromonospora purpureochromogenes TaxID=47872 RepID=A0A1C4YAV5_9ACTN|nr:hypothetical protein GA0074696_3203 [Micromonospora purpureochromogenes]
MLSWNPANTTGSVIWPRLCPDVLARLLDTVSETRLRTATFASHQISGEDVDEEQSAC